MPKAGPVYRRPDVFCRCAADPYVVVSVANELAGTAVMGGRDVQGAGTYAKHRAAEQFWAQLSREHPSGEPARTMVDGYAGERLRLGTFKHTPHVLASENIARMHRQATLLSLQLEGDSTIEQDGRRCTISAGDFCLIDLSQSFRLETGRSTVQTIYLPIAGLRDAMPGFAHPSAIVLHGHQKSVGYLRVLYKEIFASAPHLTEPVAGYLLDVIPPMLAAALQGSQFTDTPSVSQLRHHHKQQVRRFARDNLADPTLCARSIATGLGLSTSYLFELFSDEEVTLMRWVRGERLSRTCRELEDPTASRKSIAQIAYSWGFSDMAHFSRCFRKAFYISPRGCRQQAMAVLAKNK